MSKDNIVLKDLFLISSEFIRPVNMSTPSQKDKVNLEINVSHEIKEPILHGFLTITVKMAEDCYMKATMAGIFEFTPNPVIPIDSFAKVNAPAILFPFIREHFASVSSKANIGRVLLPPINFVEMANDKSKQ